MSSSVFQRVRDFRPWRRQNQSSTLATRAPAPGGGRGGGLNVLHSVQSIAAQTQFPFLQPMLAMASQIISIVQAQTGAANMRALAERSAQLVEVVITAMRSMTPEEQSRLDGNPIKKLEQELVAIIEGLQHLSRSGKFRPWSDVQQATDTLTRRLDWAIQNFQVDINVQSHIRGRRNHEELQLGIKKIENDLTMLTRMAHTTRLREILQPADARFDSFCRRRTASRCLERTRVDLLQTIGNWMSSPDPTQPRITYLHGKQGSGKSAIAQTVAEYCAGRNIPCASFFFSRDHPERREAVYVFRTIAYQLAQVIPGFGQQLGQAIQADPEICRSDLRTQVTKLILEPLCEMVAADVPSSAIVIILDGLDECEPEDHSDAIQLVRLLSEAAWKLPPDLRARIIITSRPEEEIHRRMRRMAPRVTIHNIEDDIIEADVQLYLRHRLTEVLDEDDIRRLTASVRGSFIGASTAADFVLDEYENDPKRRLEIFLSRVETQPS
ncbi:hypothetical protein FRB95_013021 [Tulasnella sp. JGI-2019a]|nr:hypothetical protein FRB93_013189 [Tulasnella sp. JGI-2019a]KAG9034568.1 hypothetical protein FRB95_013021 [Tulasnella sp. JGI-2019a]